MSAETPFEIFLIAPPGLESTLLLEAKALDFAARQVPGGVSFDGTWADVRHANLYLRGATRVLARIGSFRAFHLAQLDKRARKFPWGEVLRKDVPVKVEVVTNKKSKIYHAGAATQRIETAIAEELGAPIAAQAAEADAEVAGQVTVKVRIDDNTCIFSVDTSGEGLHKRGHKVAVGKAPMRETMAALLLRACGYSGTEPVVDPMCGSGTFVIEAAEIARGLAAGRSRDFAFELLANHDASAWAAQKAAMPALQTVDLRFYGSDRNTGAVEMAGKNAERAGVADLCQMTHAAVSDLQRPEGPAGLVMVNPPYGARIGNKKQLYAVYGALGEVLKTRFSGWRVGIVTSDTQLANATGLPFLPLGAPIAHGGLKVRLFQTAPLP
ncbi:THUMP domain-containing class I SAM-dependent RNA methyltransferase [Arenibacterium sp. LLYu02]|uniref:THUMP domain-containing class I SAM-dependent RNA methyltransferase n=1 Tax=Arenibacterium sp. LLYu02 TaxID=3404132 RepID=UPI003B21B58E